MNRKYDNGRWIVERADHEPLIEYRPDLLGWCFIGSDTIIISKKDYLSWSPEDRAKFRKSRWFQ